MKRIERNEFNYIRKSLRQFTLGYGTTLTIRTDGSAEYKQALHEHYTSLGFHPASVRVDSRMYDEKERIIYIYGLTYDLPTCAVRSGPGPTFTPRKRKSALPQP